MEPNTNARTAGVAGRLILMFLLAFCSLPGCAHPEPTLVVFVGGLGFSQLGDLRHAVIKQCPEAKVVNAGGWDGYKADVKAIATAKPHEHIIFVGHSFGCQTIDQAAAKLPRVDLAVFIDPAWDDFRLSNSIAHYLWFKRSGFGVERKAQIAGAVATKTIEGGHNDIPHSAELIAEVVAAIKGIENRSGGRAVADASR